MTLLDDTNLRKAIGARVLSEANDLKRTPQALADEMELSFDVVSAVIDGSADLEVGRNVIRRMADVYPVRLADLWVEADDTDEGVRVMRASESEASSRIFERSGRDDTISEYYEYRDTAMSRLGPFKPEWIQPIRFVEDDDAENPDVAYNKGHLLHQMTFFIGDVNFYWKVNGAYHCAEMKTGDSNYITPFVPHSFTSRDPKDPGLIIAVTFAGSVRRALDDFGLISAGDSDALAGDLRQSRELFTVRLRRHLANESITETTFAKQMGDLGVSEERCLAILKQGVEPEIHEIRIMADILNIRPQDLMTTELGTEEEVVLEQHNDETWRPWPDTNSPTLRMAPLARTRHQPGLKGFHIEVISADSGGPVADMKHGLFEYIYNYGEKPVRLHWAADRSTILEPGDSACVRPMIAHRFSLLDGETEAARIFSVRVPGALDDTALDEYARFDTDGRHRVAREVSKWF